MIICYQKLVFTQLRENYLKCIKINLLNPKGKQSWILIGRTDAEAEVPRLWPPDVKNWLTGKDPDSGKDWRLEEKGTTEDEMVGWHHWLDGREFEHTLSVGDGQGSMACCSPCGYRVRHCWATELIVTAVNWTDIYSLNTSDFFTVFQRLSKY